MTSNFDAARNAMFSYFDFDSHAWGDDMQNYGASSVAGPVVDALDLMTPNWRNHEPIPGREIRQRMDVYEGLRGCYACGLDGNPCTHQGSAY